MEGSDRRAKGHMQSHKAEAGAATDWITTPHNEARKTMVKQPTERTSGSRMRNEKSNTAWGKRATSELQNSLFFFGYRPTI